MGKGKSGKSSVDKVTKKATQLIADLFTSDVVKAAAATALASAASALVARKGEPGAGGESPAKTAPAGEAELGDAQRAMAGSKPDAPAEGEGGKKRGKKARATRRKKA
jgi:hypothetical protein